MIKFKTMYFFLATSCQLKDAAKLLNMSVDNFLDCLYGTKSFKADAIPKLYSKFFQRRFSLNQMLDYKGER